MNRQSSTDNVFILPSLIVVTLMTQFPFFLTIIYSMMRWNLSRPDLGRRFAWLANYWFFFTNPEFYTVVWQTVLLTSVTLTMCSIFGFAFSVLLDNETFGINIARTLLLGPFFVMSTASGVIWKTTILNTTFGWYGAAMRALGIEPIDLLSNYPLSIITLLFVWQWVPFFILIILTGLQSIPIDIVESSKIDGANWVQQILGVKLPIIINHISVAIMLGLVFITKDFGLILVTTAGGPGTRSYTLPYSVYKQLYSASQVGRSAALAVITVGLLLTSISILYRWITAQSRTLGS